MTNGNKFDFHDVRSLETIAERAELQAAEKPLFAVSKDAETDFCLSRSDGSGDAHAEQLDGFKAVYNPESGHVFDTVTDDYEVINPPEFIGPLAERLRERNRNDVHGNVWVRNEGGSAYAQLVFDTDEFRIWPEDGGREKPVRAGFNLRWSHDGGMTVKAEGIAQDGMCKNTIRNVSKSINVKHAGNVDERVDWGDEWDTVLDQMGAFCNSLGRVIEGAIGNTMFDLADDLEMFGEWREATDPLDILADEVTAIGPITDAQRDALYGFYELLGFPKYIGVSATSRLMFRAAQKDDPRKLSTWDVHSALTYALSHALRGTPGASDDDYHRKASDVLMNPQKAIQDADAEARSRLRPDDDQGTLFADEADVPEETGEALRAYHERTRELEESFGGA